MIFSHLVFNNEMNQGHAKRSCTDLQQGGEISKILCCVALVYNSYFFQNRRFHAEIIRH